MRPPSDEPNNAARSEPAASITARTASMRCSSVGSRSSGTGSDIPVPGLSKRMSREKDASRRRSRACVGSSHISSMFEIQPGT